MTEAEPRDSLWALVAPLAVWTAHFGACYALLAIGCLRLPHELVHAGVAVFTVVAVGPLLWMGRVAWRRYREVAGVEADGPSPASRRRFMAVTTLMLAGLAGIGVVYTAGSVALVGGCS